MYDQFYQFNSEPFRLSPDHAFAYAHKGYVKARAYMAYAFMRAEGFVMITGRPGTGKTTLVGSLVEQLADENVSVAKLVCTQLQADDLLKMVAYEFGIDMGVVEKGELLQRLTQQLKSWHRDGRRALLIVDEAQDLSVSAMEELRLLTNIQIDSKPLLQIFLLGQPELRELVLSPVLEQVHQRIVAASHLRPLELDETEAYITHRLQVVGWRGDPTLDRSIYPVIHKYSEGIPRRINLICSRLLLLCAVEQRHHIGIEDLREVLRELQDENLAVGMLFSEKDFLPATAGGESAGTNDTPDSGSEVPAPDLPAGPDRNAPFAPAMGQAPETHPAVGPAPISPPDQAGGERTSSGRQSFKVITGGTGSGVRNIAGGSHSLASEAAPAELGFTDIVAPPAEQFSAKEAAGNPSSGEHRRAGDGGRARPVYHEPAGDVRGRDPGEHAAPGRAAGHHSSGSRPEFRSKRYPPRVKGRAGNEASGLWEIGVILIVSVVVVIWLASGIELRSFLH